MKKLGTCVFLVLFVPMNVFAATENFDGCKGISVTKSRDLKAVDVSADLQKAQKRVTEICEKVLPKKLNAIYGAAKSCVTSAKAGTAAGIDTEVAAFKARVEDACKSMRKTLAESAHFCSVRKSSLDKIQKDVAGLETAVNDQAKSQANVANLYRNAATTYGVCANQAATSKEKIYQELPDKDENQGRNRREGKESASTSDVKTDKLIADLQASFDKAAADNANKNACKKLSAKGGGQLAEVGTILKNNLWPNGKVAARAIARLETVDRAKATEYSGMQTKAAANSVSAGAITPDATTKGESDISGTEEVGATKDSAEASHPGSADDSAAAEKDSAATAQADASGDAKAGASSSAENQIKAEDIRAKSEDATVKQNIAADRIKASQDDGNHGAAAVSAAFEAKATAQEEEKQKMVVVPSAARASATFGNFDTSLENTPVEAKAANPVATPVTRAVIPAAVVPTPVENPEGITQDMGVIGKSGRATASVESAPVEAAPVIASPVSSEQSATAPAEIDTSTPAPAVATNCVTSKFSWSSFSFEQRNGVLNEYGYCVVE